LIQYRYLRLSQRKKIHHLTVMKKAREASTEVICQACDGTGFQKLKQPTEPGRRIYPATCKECLGKGKLKAP
jgi:DnaJ-class molecular chaperone